MIFTGCAVYACSVFTVKKLECLKQALGLNTLAWNNQIGSESYFVGFGWLRE